MIITAEQSVDRIRLIAVEMKGAPRNEGALPLFEQRRFGAIAPTVPPFDILPAVVAFIAGIFILLGC